MLTLSFSTLNLLHTCPHNFLNKQMQIKPEEKKEWAEGKHCHDLIQAHVSGKKKHKYLKYIKCKFPVVEEQDFDPRCKWEKIFKMDGEDFKIIGFYDGRTLDFTQLLEGKFSSSGAWSISKFQKSMQRKLYAWSDFRFEEAIIITGQRDPKLWKDDPPKVYKVPMTGQDRDDAIEWIREGIHIFKDGDFLKDLEIINGKPTCTNKWCWWGNRCHWKI